MFVKAIEKITADIDRAKKDLRMVEMECRTLDSSQRGPWKAVCLCIAFTEAP